MSERGGGPGAGLRAALVERLSTIAARVPASIRRRPTPRQLAIGLALVTGLLVLAIAHEVFPYHSLNHDEGVYLQQAAMLLEGQLVLEPPVTEAFRPWFFVADGGGDFYPKYTPVPAATFAVGGLVGWYRLSLALVAAGTVLATYGTVAEAFDRRAGVAAAALLVASPLFIVQASVFLPYLPTLFLELTFAWAYLRADRTDDARLAALAGAAIGLAFFARPYTAVLFATPFVALALWRLRSLERPGRRRTLLTAGLGLVGVALTLGYNAVLTGEALTFPYQAFAPEDDLGFGHRQLLGHETVYTLSLAVRAGLANLRVFLTDWVVAAPLGGLLAMAGVGLAVRRRSTALDGRTLAIAGLFVTVPVGELYFWGTLNVLGDLGTAGDGLVSMLGPYYHLDILVPTVAFAGFFLVRTGEWGLSRLAALDGSATRAVAAIALVLLAGASGALAIGAVEGPLSDNGDVTAIYEEAYDPIESRDFDDAVVYLPQPYGPWLNHPFQHLRNDPGYDGEVVYALDNAPFPVADAFPERTLYRYSYRGAWGPAAGEPVTPQLRRVRRVRGDAVTLSATVGVPAYAEFVSIRMDSDAGHGAATVVDPSQNLTVDVVVRNDQATLTGPGVTEPVTVPLERLDSLEVRLFVDLGGVDSLPYRLEVPLSMADGDRRALSPRMEVCVTPARCDGEATYVPGAYREGVHLTATLEEGGGG